MIPKGPWNGAQKGSLGSEVAKLIPRGHRERPAGSESRDLIPEGACEGGAEGQKGLEMLILLQRAMLEGGCWIEYSSLDPAELALTGRFQGEEALLSLEPCGISAQAAFSVEHPVTGDDQGYGIVSDCTADGLRRYAHVGLLCAFSGL